MGVQVPPRTLTDQASDLVFCLFTSLRWMPGAHPRRTVTISSEIARRLSRLVEDKAADDFVFMTPTGRPIHNADFYERVWHPLMKKLTETGVPPFRFHDLRHTHVAGWSRVALPYRTSRPVSAMSRSPRQSTPTATYCPSATS